MNSGVSVEAAGLIRRFGSKTVLDNLNFAAAPGEFVVIVSE